MKRRVDVDIDPERAGISAPVDRDRDILDRTERKVMRGRPVTAEGKIVVEAHGVDAEPEQGPLAAARTRHLAQFGQLTTLMFQNLAQTERRLSNNIGQR